MRSKGEEEEQAKEESGEQLSVRQCKGMFRMMQNSILTLNLSQGMYFSETLLRRTSCLFQMTI